MIKKLSLLLLSVFILVSCGGGASKVDIINPDADFLYFYGATCPHCQDLNKNIEEADLFTKIAVEKREVWYNKANQALFYETAASLGLKESDLSVPFVYDKQTKQYAVGTDDAWDLFQTRVGLVGTGGTLETSPGTVQ